MSTTRRRGVALATASVLALSLVAACSPGSSDDPTTPADPTTDTGDPGEELPYADQRTGAMDEFGVDTTFQATEPVTFSLLYRDHPGYPVVEDWRVFTAIEENQNVTFDRIDVPLGEWDDRKALLIGAGDHPWIIPVTYAGQETQFVAGGALLPVSDYLDLLPNFSDKVAKWGIEQELENLRQEDGKFYILPGLHERVRPQYSIAIRKDLWDAQGLDLNPATWDEFADQLRTIKEAYPDLAYPFADRWELNSTLNQAAANFGTRAGWGFGNGEFWTGSEFVFAGATDEYRQLLEYFAGLVEEGLLDPESATSEDDPQIQKFISGQSAAIGTNDQNVVEYRNAFVESGNTEAEVYQIRVPSGPAGDIIAGSQFESGVILNAELADSEYLVAVLQFVDWLYFSDEGLEFAKWGIEGETFEWDGDRRVFIDNIDQNGINPSDDPVPLNATFGFHNGEFMLAHGSTSDLANSMLRDEVREWQEAMSTKTQAPIAPPWPLTEVEQEEAAIWQTALTDTVNQQTRAFIVGNQSFDQWDAYIAALNGSNLERYVDLVNTAQQRVG